MTPLATVLAPLLEQAASRTAEGAPGGLPGCGGSSTTQMVLMMALVFAIFYFLMIRPSQKREKERQNMLGNLKPGDSVITAGGLVGKVTGTSDKYVVIEISPKVRVRVLRAQIAGIDRDDADDKSRRDRKGAKKAEPDVKRKPADRDRPKEPGVAPEASDRAEAEPGDRESSDQPVEPGR